MVCVGVYVERNSDGDEARLAVWTLTSDLFQCGENPSSDRSRCPVATFDLRPADPSRTISNSFAKTYQRTSSPPNSRAREMLFKDSGWIRFNSRPTHLLRHAHFSQSWVPCRRGRRVYHIQLSAGWNAGSRNGNSAGRPTLSGCHPSGDLCALPTASVAARPRRLCTPPLKHNVHAAAKAQRDSLTGVASRQKKPARIFAVVPTITIGPAITKAFRSRDAVKFPRCVGSTRTTYWTGAKQPGAKPIIGVMRCD
jgi:hypothetical protein